MENLPVLGFILISINITRRDDHQQRINSTVPLILDCDDGISIRSSLNIQTQNAIDRAVPDSRVQEELAHRVDRQIMSRSHSCVVWRVHHRYRIARPRDPQLACINDKCRATLIRVAKNNYTFVN